jgi:hypothetical protein
MEWTQFAVFLLGNMVFTLTLWLWSRAESRADHRRFEDAIKDFHGRLCSIESRNRNNRNRR